MTEPITPEMETRMRAAGWRPCRHDGRTVDECTLSGIGTRRCLECGAHSQLVLVTTTETEWVHDGHWVQ